MARDQASSGCALPQEPSWLEVPINRQGRRDQHPGRLGEPTLPLGSLPREEETKTQLRTGPERERFGMNYELRALRRLGTAVSGEQGGTGRVGLLSKTVSRAGADSIIENLPAVFCGTRSAFPPKHARKVLLRLKPAGHGDIQDADIPAA